MEIEARKLPLEHTYVTGRIYVCEKYGLFLCEFTSLILQGKKRKAYHVTVCVISHKF